jgi:hypothetical protein
VAQCFQVMQDGTLAATGEPVTECTGYVLLSGSEHALIATFTELFTWPAPEVVFAWLAGAFTFVLVMNVVAYITGAVVKSVSTERA